MLSVSLIPGFQTNYFFAVHAEDTPGHCVIVDPGDAAPVIAYLEERNIIPSALFITHHHPDHIGGIDTLVSRYACPVYGSGNDAARIPCLSHPLYDGDSVKLYGEEARVLDIPGHTVGHIAFYVASSHLLFSGDTLFGMGCGRMFEGTPAQFHQSLQRIAALPDETRVYCAHEYTVDNARFCVDYTKGDTEAQRRLTQAEQQRKDNIPTVPLRLGEEKHSNPFLRAATPEAFADIRRAKDRYRL